METQDGAAVLGVKDIMRNLKTGCKFLLLLGLIGFMGAADCTGKRPGKGRSAGLTGTGTGIGGGTGPSTTATVGPDKDIEIYEWKQVKGMVRFKPTGDKVDLLAVSKNEEWLYVVGNEGRELFVA